MLTFKQLVAELARILRAGEALVEKVVEARERKLRGMIRSFQNEPDAGKSHARWRQIEKEVFGVEYNDQACRTSTGCVYRRPSGTTSKTG